MSSNTFYQKLRKKSDRLWNSIFEHPFVLGIGNGSLARDRFGFYLKQDYVYSIDFSWLLVLASAKAPVYQGMGYFTILLNATLNTEMELHRKTCASVGIGATELEKTEKSMITSAYTSLLLRTCYEGILLDILAVLLPCSAGYVEIGQRLKKQGFPENTFYQDWINTYSSPEFCDLIQWLFNKMNEYAGNAADMQSKNCFDLYRSSARFEYLFFEMSWRKEL
jgi:thiaminase/transcriptional activator TenA